MPNNEVAKDERECEGERRYLRHREVGEKAATSLSHS